MYVVKAAFRRSYEAPDPVQDLQNVTGALERQKRSEPILSYEDHAEEVRSYTRALVAHDMEGGEPEEVPDGLVDYLVGVAAHGDPDTIEDLSPNAKRIVEEVSWHIDFLDSELQE